VHREEKMTEQISQLYADDLNVVHVVKQSQVDDGNGGFVTVTKQYSIAPSQSYASEDAEIQTLCEAKHTDDAIAAYNTWIDAQP
jgi:hypothetical protein